MDPALDVGAYQIGTPHVLSLAPVIGALEMFEEVGIARIREKSLQLTAYMLRTNSTGAVRLRLSQSAIRSMRLAWWAYIA